MDDPKVASNDSLIELLEDIDPKDLKMMLIATIKFSGLTFKQRDFFTLMMEGL